ncbi:CPBP family intramembrane metalloprotease [Planktothrix sp. FACHB-1355]|uniref:CPBP family intramembrane metalloprotease n=2 Tax=Cyanophyceae TaxID=3028117 RepID=A0A926VNB3_9CYAN|nr:CPBP family intramembrane metalloprotease [Aerosakkonema funiforme FACHB-1375]MBD3561634.1 CPBP family intramembrane metalloprotease [Planktothrix sp. FACHB-1355]
MNLFERRVGAMLLFVAEAPALLRAIAFLLVWVICWLPIAIPIAIALKWHPPKPLEAKQKLPLLASLYLIAPLLLWGIAGVEGVSFSNYGITLNPRILFSMGLGLAGGAIGIAILFAIQWALGWVDWQIEKDTKLLQILLTTLLIGLWVSGTEELIFRGFLLNELQQDYSIWIAAIISSSIFALLHLVWEIRETLPQLPGLWLMGMVLVSARLVDNGSLGLAWGLHAGWIWGIATIDTAKLVKYTDKVSPWITGFWEKPLAGVMGILCLLATGLVLMRI